MSDTSFLKTRTSSETKRLIQAAAANAYLTQAAWLRRATDTHHTLTLSLRDIDILRLRQ